MELKKYQKTVLRDLDSFIDFLSLTGNPSQAYNLHWDSKDVRVGLGSGCLKPYNNQLGSTPHVCFKVPTGGGKTFLACCSIKHIFDKIQSNKPKVVVWLVPSDAILEQTLKNLKNSSHPYRQKIDFNWNGKVEIYSKKDLLDGKTFNPSAITGQLSIMVLSFDTFRANDKESRKIYQANSNLLPFVDFIDKNDLLDNCDPSSLMQIMHYLKPVVIVDESHNATSDLSIEMLRNIGPSFVLDLTATPRANSNIISFVSAKDLKKENMIKLPVVVYNRPNQTEVITDSIDLRNKLERDAIREKEISGRYIRPIVLFQAQPRNSEEDTTFIRLKEKLLQAGIKEEEIAIKTSLINEIKDVDLLSEDCKIRYIITVNALKEGWDCPFAYILASLANRSSSVDVEQILGRILRLPNTTRATSNFLNMSYVMTNSDNFREALDNIVEGLNAAGFTKRDCVVPTIEETPRDRGEIERINLFEDHSDDVDFNPELVQAELEERRQSELHLSDDTIIDTSTDLGKVLEQAKGVEQEYNDISRQEEESGAIFNPEEYEHMNIFDIRPEFLNEVRSLRLPQFYINIEGNLFWEESETLLTKERCTQGFTLAGQPLPTGLSAVSDDIYKVDVITSDNGSMHSAYERMNRESSEKFKETLQSVKPEYRIKHCTESIIARIDGRFDCVSKPDLSTYIYSIVNGMTKDELYTLPDNIASITEKIRKHINGLIDKYRYENFLRMVDLNQIKTRETYIFPTQINPLQHTDRITKSLYKEERDDLNNTEFQVINRLNSLDIKWWHRIIANKENEFKINASLNHYPDFVICTKRGTIIMVEVKGEDRDGSDSQQKVKIGRVWQTLSGNVKYKYFMVFLNQAMREEGAVSLDELSEMITAL